MVAGIYYPLDSSNISKIRNADSRYYDSYGPNIIGDGLSETVRWYSASYTNYVGAEGSIYQRGLGGMFGFYLHKGIGSGGSSTNNSTYYPTTYATTRAVVVCGEGL